MMIKTSFDEIVFSHCLGSIENPLKLNDLLNLADNEKDIPAASSDTEKILFLGIDLQLDFLESGSLAVTGSNADLDRLLKWLYDNLVKITQIRLSQDTHNIYQIFHPAWWVDSDGKNPDSSPITLQDLDDKKWLPVVNPIGSRDYVENLEKLGKKTLVIWPYHCIQGTSGCLIDPQLMNLALFHSRIRRSRLSLIVKGTDPLSEMYGIFKPEYSPKDSIDLNSLNAIEKFDKIVISGQAKSHCVLESISQMLEHYQSSPDTIKKIFVLEDTMSSIDGFEDATKDEFDRFKSEGVNLVNTTDFVL